MRKGGLAMNSKTVVGGGTACKETDLTPTHLTPPRPWLTAQNVDVQTYLLRFLDKSVSM